jgi:hypothetical protein
MEYCNYHLVLHFENRVFKQTKTQIRPHSRPDFGVIAWNGRTLWRSWFHNGTVGDLGALKSATDCGL